MDLLRGQRVKLENLTASNKFAIGVTIKTSLTIDYSCFGLDSEDRLNDERYMTFYNQQETPCKGVCLETNSREDDTGFKIDLDRLPDKIQKIIVTAAIDGQGTMSEIKCGHIRIIERGIPVMKFFIQGSDFDKERALMLIEIYKKDNQWRIHGLGQGFNGGLDALVKYFGGEVAEPGYEQLEEAIPVHQDMVLDSFSNNYEREMPVESNSNGRTCIRCQKKIGIVGKFLGYNIRTNRCSKCENEVKKELISIRQKFVDYSRDQQLSDNLLRETKSIASRSNISWEETTTFLHDDVLNFLKQRFLHFTKDGFLSSNETLLLKNIAAEAGLDWREASKTLHEEILKFLERTLAFYAADGVITEDEDQEFSRLCKKFSEDFYVPNANLDSLLGRIAYLKEITKIRQGNLKTLETNVHLDSDEICYMEIEATYQKKNQKSTTPIRGKLVATNKKINFLSESGGWTILWKNVMDVKQQGSYVVLELSTTKGNGYYQVRDALLTEATLTTITRIAKRQLLAPTDEDAVQSRRIPPEVKTAVWQRDQGRCVQCNSNSYLEFDHVIPFSKGGANTVNNIQLLCRRCNLEKGDRL